jgi:hypothetical protein
MTFLHYSATRHDELDASIPNTRNQHDNSDIGGKLALELWTVAAEEHPDKAAYRYDIELDDEDPGLCLYAGNHARDPNIGFARHQGRIAYYMGKIPASRFVRYRLTTMQQYVAD